MTDFLYWLLIILLQFTQPATLPSQVRVEPEYHSAGWVLVCYEGCDLWSDYAPDSIRHMPYASREQAFDAYILMRTVRFDCLYVPRPYRATVRMTCDGFGVYAPS